MEKNSIIKALDSLCMEELKDERDKYKSALKDILNCLGTGECTVNNCDGCQVEVTQAIAIAKEALWDK